MASTSKDKWLKFFMDAKIPKSAAEEYTLTFVENRIQSDMLLDLDKDYLNAMGITVMGDIIAILRYAKVSHVQNAKKNMMSKSSTSLSKPAASISSQDSNYRSVSLKKSTSSSSLKSNSNTNTIIDSKPKIVQSNSTKPKDPIIKESLQTTRSLKIKDDQFVDKPYSNGVQPKVENEFSTKPILVRTPLVRKRPSSEILKTSVSDKHDESISSDSSESGIHEPIEDITRKMAKKSIFDRLGNRGQNKSPPVDSSERAVSSSTSPPVTSAPVNVKKVVNQSESTPRAPKPGTLSYRMFPSHVHSTSPDDHMDVILDTNDRILVEIDQTEPVKSPPPTRVEYTVALPPDFHQPASSNFPTASKSSSSVFDRLGSKNKDQSLSSSSASNPGKSILKLSSSSVRIAKSSSPTTIVTTKRDFKTVSSLSNKINLIRSQMKTEGVLGKPEHAMHERVPARARIGINPASSASLSRTNPSSASLTRTNPSSASLSRTNPSSASLSRTNSSSATPSSVKARLTLGQGAQQSDKKPVLTRLDVLAKKTLSSTPGHVKARIESEQQKFLSKAKCGSGIKARLGFKTRGEKDTTDPYPRRTKSMSPEKMEQIIEREILTNDEEEAEMTLDGRKRVRFHCVEKKMIPHRTEDKLLQRRFSSPIPYNRNRARVW